MTDAVGELKLTLGPADRARLGDYLDDVREIERRIQNVEAYNASGEPRELPAAPIGVPDSFEEHVKLMFDLQAVAFASDTTRVFALKLSRDVSNRVFPGSGSSSAFHTISHHQEKEDKIAEFQKINTYHVSLVPYLLNKLRNTPDGEGTLLDNSLVIYGSPMGDSNLHNHKRCPLFLAGRAGGRLKGNVHVKAADGAPMANAMLAALHALGADDIERFGDSTTPLDLTGGSESVQMNMRTATVDSGVRRSRGGSRAAGLVRAAARAPVADAAERGDASTIHALLKQGADVSAAQPDGMTALHWAALRGDADLTSMLLFAGANVRATTRLGSYTALHLASRAGNAAHDEGASRRRRRPESAHIHRRDAADARGRNRRHGRGEAAARSRRRRECEGVDLRSNRADVRRSARPSRRRRPARGAWSRSEHRVGLHGI